MKKHSAGAATLLMSLILVMVVTLLMVFAANYGTLMSRSTANLLRGAQAYEAAQAGLEFGVAYLINNKTTITASAISGSINYGAAIGSLNVTLANNSSFAVRYTNPTPFNVSLIQITSTGINDDSTSTVIVSQLVNVSPILTNAPTLPLRLPHQVTMTGNAQVVNLFNNSTITAGESISFVGNANTETAAGGSNRFIAGSDIQQNVTALNNTTEAQLFSDYFTGSIASIMSAFENVYSNSSDTNYNSQLDGKTGTSIAITQTDGSSARLSANTVVGSPDNPVIIIVDGNLEISGNAIIYGFIFIKNSDGASLQEVQLSGNAKIIGGVVATGQYSGVGNSQVIFDPSVLASAQQAITTYAKVPGSWKDF